MSSKVGYIYTPPSASNNYIPDIMEWVGYPQFDFHNVKNSFLKVAYIQEHIAQTSAVEFRPNTDELAMSQHTGFIVPEGWKKMCVYTDEELATLPAIQKVIKPDANISYSADFGDDDFMSAISSLSDGMWTNNNTSVFEACSPANSTGISFGQPFSPAPEMLLVSQHPAVAPPPTVLFKTFIPPPVFIARPELHPLEGNYILCSPERFNIGIQLNLEFMGKYFKSGHVCMQDTRTWAKHHLNIFGLETTSSFNDRCVRLMEETITVSKSYGIQCNQTGQRIDFDIFSTIGWATGERDALIKILKNQSTAYIDKPDRVSIGGYGLRSRPVSTVPAYINSLTGLMSHDGVASSINFTRDAGGRPYRRGSILILIAQRLLRPVETHSSKDSLLVLFSDDYKEIPEQLLSMVCAMYVVMFKRRLARNPGSLRTPDVREETDRQLNILRMVRNSGSDEGSALNSWITTRDGDDGWLADLRDAMLSANSLRGPNRYDD
ncbi:hypothetical protein C8R48DRAFT_768993 [Suillus tomentosus]|nr:hypothetical protein C8R48DRAFT_768993 [Suillus tomentosus]